MPTHLRLIDMNLYETPEESLRRFLSMLEELNESPLGSILEEEVTGPMRQAFCTLLPEEGRDVDTVAEAFAEYKSIISLQTTSL